MKASENTTETNFQSASPLTITRSINDDLPGVRRIKSAQELGDSSLFGPVISGKIILT